MMDASGTVETFATKTCGGEQAEYYEPAKASDKVAEDNAAGFRFYHISELAELPPPSFLIDGLYVEKTFNLHYGPAKSGKTHLQSQVSYDLALGTPHFGRSVRKTGTLILAGEGADAIGLRARAFAKHHGADLRDMDIGILAGRIDHKVSDKHLNVYLDELEFRFNNRKNPFLFRETMKS